MLLVVHPAIGAVLVAEAIFESLLAYIEQRVHLRLDTLEVVGVHVLPPEIWIVEILVGGVAEQVLDVVADEGRREVVFGLEAVDHGRRRGQEARRAFLRRSFGVLVALAGGGVESLLNDGLDRGPVGARAQQFRKRRSCLCGVVFRSGHCPAVSAHVNLPVEVQCSAGKLH